MDRRQFLRAFAWGTVASVSATVPGAISIMASAVAAKRAAAERLYSMPVGGRFGYVDRLGRLVIAPAYETTYGFHDGLAFFKAGDLYGLIDAEGGRIAAPTFEAFALTETFSDGLCGVKHAGLWGFIDRDGAWVVPPRFAQVRGFSHRLACVQSEKDGRWGYIDDTGAFVIAPRFSNAYPFREDVAAVCDGELYGLIDTAGRWVLAPCYLFLPGFVENRSRALVGRQQEGFIDHDGRLVVPARYLEARDYQAGLALAALPSGEPRPRDLFYKHRFSAIDLDGREQFSLEPGDYPLGGLFCDRLAVGRHLHGYATRRYGFLDRAGRVAIDFAFDDVCVFHDTGVAYAELGGRRRLIDVDGRTLAYTERRGDREVLIDADGNVAWAAD